MLILQMRRATLPAKDLERFESFLSAVPRTFRPLIEPIRAAQAEILGHAVEFLNTPDDTRSVILAGARARVARKAEIFTDGTSLIVIAIFERVDERERKTDPELSFILSYIGPDRSPEVLGN